MPDRAPIQPCRAPSPSWPQENARNSPPGVGGSRSRCEFAGRTDLAQPATSTSSSRSWNARSASYHGDMQVEILSLATLCLALFPSLSVAALVQEGAGEGQTPVQEEPTGENLQALLDQAEDGAHIILEARRYTTDTGFELRDKTNVTVEGVEGTELACTSRIEDVFRVRGGSGITLRGLRMFHTMEIKGLCAGNVLAALETRDLTVENCDLNGCGVTGLYTWGTFGVRATGNLIHDNSSAGFGFRESGKIELRNNRLEANGQAMVGVPGWLVVEGNTVDGAPWDPRPEPIDRPEDVGPRTRVEASWDGASVSKEDRTRALALLQEAEDAWAREGNLAGMVETLREAVATNPELARAQELLLRALWHAQVPLEERLATAERALAVFPKNPRLLYFYAKGLFEGGHIADAERACEVATTKMDEEVRQRTSGSYVDRGWADAYFLRGEIKLALGEFDSADTWFSTAKTFGQLRANSWSAAEADIHDIPERATQRMEQLKPVLAYLAADERAAQLARDPWKEKMARAVKLREQGEFAEARALVLELTQDDTRSHEAGWMLVGLALDEWDTGAAKDWIEAREKASRKGSEPMSNVEYRISDQASLQLRHLEGYALEVERIGYGEVDMPFGVGAGAPAWWAPALCREGIFPEAGLPVHDPNDPETQELRRAIEDWDKDRVQELATRLLARDPFHPDALFVQAYILSNYTGGPAEKYARWAERAKEILWLERPDAWRRAHTLNLIGQLLTMSMRDANGTWSDAVGTRALEYLLAARDAMRAIEKEPSGVFYRSALYNARGIEDAPLVLELLDEAQAQGAQVVDPTALRRWAEEQLRALAPAEAEGR
ncbi:MAG TPA: hypothetical protein ENJ09_01125 [Planctomycetes bacterium]|nr:hypothetical protein [Planctomycetota bacterium]